MRLTAADTQMYDYARPGTAMWADAAWRLTFTGTAPSIEELRQHIGARLPLVPGLTRKVVPSRVPVARPRWVEDPEFAIADHVREAGDGYAGADGWERLVDERLGTPLDLTRPLWQILLARSEGDDRFALILHHHHALADGHSGIHALRILCADEAVPAREEPAGRTESVGLGDRARAVLREAGNVGTAMRLVYPPAPEVRGLNAPIGPRRRALTAEVSMRDVMPISLALRCFPNDVYLTAVAGGLRRWLRGRGVDVEGVEIQAGVPVNASRGQRWDLGNHFSGVRLPLPLGTMPATERLSRIQAGTKRISAGRASRGAELISKAQNVLPRQVLQPLAQAEWGPKALNIVTSHIALPRTLKGILGRPLESLACWTPLFGGHVVSVVAAQGVRGTMMINVLVEADLAPDADVILDGIHREIAELGKAVGAPRRSPVLAGTS